MTDGEAILAAIIANPKEDTPRLVYADWLEENGQSERAEFIRVQIELAQESSILCQSKQVTPCYARPMVVPLCDGCERRMHLLHRQNELWPYRPSAKHAEWFGFAMLEVDVHRGFARKLKCLWMDWLLYDTTKSKTQPIEKVVLLSLPGYHWTERPWDRQHYLSVDLPERYARTYYDHAVQEKGAVWVWTDLFTWAFGQVWPGIEFQWTGLLVGMTNTRSTLAEAAEDIRPGDLVGLDANGRVIRHRPGTAVVGQAPYEGQV